MTAVNAQGECKGSKGAPTGTAGLTIADIQQLGSIELEPAAECEQPAGRMDVPTIKSTPDASRSRGELPTHLPTARQQ